MPRFNQKPGERPGGQPPVPEKPVVNSRRGVGGSSVAGGDTPDSTALSLRADLTGKERPHMLFVPTARATRTRRWHVLRRFARIDRGEHLPTFPYPPADLRELVLSQDAICVSGGNTANMLAIWRVHGIDQLMREAWEQGTVLWGASAGMICWFEQGVTDSFGPQLESMDCLGFLPGSACPHYDGEERRRPRYRELVDGGISDGIAADDGAALHYVGTELRRSSAAAPARRHTASRATAKSR